MSGRVKHLLRLGGLLLVTLSTSCLKDFFVPKPDPKIFSCKINGETFVPSATILSAEAQATIDGSRPPFRIHINTGSDEIDIQINNVAEGTGIYEFGKYTQMALYANHATGKGYLADSLGQGSVTLQNFDPAAKYITGTFWFNAINTEDPTDSVKITDGHFYITAINKRKN